MRTSARSGSQPVSAAPTFPAGRDDSTSPARAVAHGLGRRPPGRRRHPRTVPSDTRRCCRRRTVPSGNGAGVRSSTPALQSAAAPGTTRRCGDGSIEPAAFDCGNPSGVSRRKLGRANLPVVLRVHAFEAESRGQPSLQAARLDAIQSRLCPPQQIILVHVAVGPSGLGPHAGLFQRRGLDRNFLSAAVDVQHRRRLGRHGRQCAATG